MPGRLLELTADVAAGWAVHPRLVDYRVVVNVVHRSTVVRSVLAERSMTAQQGPSPGVPCGFRIDLAGFGLGREDLPKLRFCIGETDERIALPVSGSLAPVRRLVVEDLLREAPRPRPWVIGMTYLDAEAAGLRVETIVDLLYRDYLGRPADPNGLAHYSHELRAGRLTYDDLRRGFTESDEFRLHRKYLDTAPGSIFSQKIVMAAAARDAGQVSSRPTTGHIVAAGELAVLDGREFVEEVYRRVLMKEADEDGILHYLHQMKRGTAKLEVIRIIAGELEAITAGVRVVGYETAEPGPAVDASAVI